MVEKQDDKGRCLENMEIWNKVSKTDVDHTKEVSFGRKFTAIDAHSQIMEATREFGAVGEGWGYSNEYGEIHLTDGRIIAWCDVTFWWHRNGTWEGMPTPAVINKFGPVRGAAMMVSFDKNGKIKAPDTDAYKKASTDGLTKLISHLGFNADVFLGMFDDNKYVANLKKEKDSVADETQRLYNEQRKEFIATIQSCKTGDEMDKALNDSSKWINGLPAGTAVELRGWVAKQKAELNKDDK